ncbi:MAG: Calx-beta domain-containing protein, partial [Pseudomonadota bacterium]
MAIEITGDNEVELTEQFSLVVTPPADRGINVQSAVGQATLLDDDTNIGPVLSISDAEASEGEFLRFSVTLSEPSFDAVTVQYRSLFSSTADGLDLFYDAADSRTNSTLTFAPGETSKDIFIFPRDTSADEIDEFFSLELHNVTGNARLAGGEQTLRATGTILDTDGLGNDTALHVSDPTIVEGDSGSKFAVFDIRLSRPATQDFIATYETVDGSALAGEDYVAASGAISFVRGQSIASVAVEVVGDTVTEISEQFSLVVNQSAVNGRGAVGEATIADDDAGSGPVISVADGISVEGESILFTITLSEPSADAVSVSYRTLLTSTADNGDIFYGLNDSRTTNTITFAPGQTSLEVAIFPRSDSSEETDEFFALELFAPSENATLAGGEPTIRATGTILDDDGAGANAAMHVSNPVIIEGDGDARFAVFDVELSQPASGPFTATYTTIDGTATAGEDYVAQSGSISFSAGQRTTSVIVELTGDLSTEYSESFSLAVTPPTSPLINGRAAVGEATILDDDAGAGVDLPVISISDGIGLEGEIVQYIISLSKPSSEEVSFELTAPVLDGTAEATDFFGSTTTQTVTIPPGRTSVAIFASSRSDSTDERDESFSITLSDVVNAVFE